MDGYDDIEYIRQIKSQLLITDNGEEGFIFGFAAAAVMSCSESEEIENGQKAEINWNSRVILRGFHSD